MAESARSSIFDEIVRFNANRLPELVKLKFERMVASEFAFFRGTDHLFAHAWSDLKPADVGPAILICGDLHLENFGAFRSDDGSYSFDINDFDEAIVGPCSFDLVRCGTSTLLAAQEWRLTPLQAASVLWAFLDSYRSAVLESMRTSVVGALTRDNAEGPIRELLGATMIGAQVELLDKHTEKKAGTRRIVRSEHRHPDISADSYAIVKEAVESYGRTINAAGAYEVLDVAGRVAGIGSLGLPRYTVLVAGGGRPNDNRLIDLKEERASSVLSCTDIAQPDFGGNEARRVVEAQRCMQAQPAAGLASLSVDGHWFRLREMIPDENRSRLDRLAHKPEELRRAVEIAGRLTAWSHIRGNRLGKVATTASLGDWVAGPGLEATLAAAIQFAVRTQLDFQAFHKACDKVSR
jgi:uncharacterized protein (DUF2252 family)